MVVAKIYVDGTRAIVTGLASITMGMQGAQVEVEYNGIWNGLNRTAVFAGSVVKDIVNAGELLTIPAEITEKPGRQLRVGFYGVDGDGKVVIPTLWATLGIIQDGTDPSGDTSTDPSLPVWAQLQREVEKLKKSVDTGGGIEVETDPTVPAWAKQPEKPTYTAQEVGALPNTTKIPDDYVPQSELESAINSALAKAKESGEFDGRPGDPGRTPVKGEDYYTDEDKSEIVDQVVEEINPILDGKAAMPLTIYADNAPTTGENSVSGIPIFTIDYSPSDLKKYQDAGARVKIVRYNRHYEMYEATDESAKFRFVEPTDTQVDGYHAVLDTNKAVTITRTTHKSKMESTTGGAVGQIPRIKSLNSKGLPATWEFVDITDILPVYNGEVEEV